MHEVGIIQEMLTVAGRSAREAGCQSIRRIVLRVGVFSSAVPEALAFAFEALKRGTMAEAASLEIERVGATAWCPRCEREFSVDDVVLQCPGCGEISAELRRGFELDLMRLEAE